MRLPGFSQRIKAPGTSTRSGRIAVMDRNTAIGHRALGKYELVQLIGEGSNGEVYLARVVGNPEQCVVVKRVKEHILQNPNFRKFFDGEIASMQRFYHPYAVRFFEATLSDPLGPLLVLEYIHGVTLEAVINHYLRLVPEHVGRLLGQLCHALQAAHDAGIMHRDLKPANVMVVGFGTPEEHVKVMDFGFAGFTEKPHIQLAELTGHGPMFACGTPAYVSPEMVRGDSVDARSDIYGVGVILYELLTGRLPFEYPTVEEILAGHVREQPPKMRDIGANDVPAAVEAVVNIALSKYPAERYATPRDLANHFGQAIGWDLWKQTAPLGYDRGSGRQKVESSMVIQAPPAGTKEAKFVLSDLFDAMLPPRLASAKLKGFVDDYGGVVVESEPGVIRMRFGLPSGYKEPSERSGLFKLMNVIRSMTPESGEEPIEVALQMKKHADDANRVRVVVSFHPMKEFLPSDPKLWQGRCEQVNSALRMYLMASG